MNKQMQETTLRNNLADCCFDLNDAERAHRKGESWATDAIIAERKADRAKAWEELELFLRKPVNTFRPGKYI